MPKAKPIRRLVGAIYARFSKRFQHSIEDQVRTCREWAAANGVHVPDEFIFKDEAVTGRSSRRNGLRALTAAVESGRVDVVIVFMTSRLFRRQYKSLAFVEEEIVDRGLRCVFVRSGIDTAQEDKWRQLLQVQGLIDEFVLEMTAQHVRAAHEGLLLQMRVFGTVSFGFVGEVIEGVTTRSGRPAKRLAVNPEQATWVRQVFDWFTVDRLSIAEIVRRMNGAQAPLPPRSDTRRWTRTAVSNLLRNERFIGNWAYGRCRAVWQNKKNYVRYMEREQPLREVAFEALRIIDDATWQTAQQCLADLSRNAGRKPKDGDRLSRPLLLNEFFICHKHQTRLRVGGGHGKYMICAECRDSPEPYLFTYLRRDVAVEQICTKLAELIRNSPELATVIVDRAKEWAANLDQPDSGELDRLQRQIQRLTEQIEFVLGAPGETEQDRNENHKKLAALRQERARLSSELARLQETVNQPRQLPGESAIQEAIDDICQILNSAASSQDPTEVAAVHEVVSLMTGGRIELSQMGEARSHKGWLRATLRVSP